MFYNIVAIYAPDYQILMGDFNLTLDPNLDRNKYKNNYDNHSTRRAVVNSWITEEE